MSAERIEGEILIGADMACSFRTDNMRLMDVDGGQKDPAGGGPQRATPVRRAAGHP
ncbi:hypothetical protein COLSTE_01580 [Collinsella stercoris DSM 13279]|uniref:Uncharacterized protein n=1 Tax=Collinsella stercoris DSM 13279 TaxID=445975 RepID=B6GBW6_9ACTN|nr:hypothetical protein COLSTE_01580 [Collinsella stercoris DSM 13279]